MSTDSKHILDFISDMRSKKQTFVYGGTVPTHVALASLYERMEVTKMRATKSADELRTANSQIVALLTLLNNTNSRLNMSSKEQNISDATFEPANKTLERINALLAEIEERGNLVISDLYKALGELEMQMSKLKI